MPRFEPFAALRYADATRPGYLERVIAPPYDVLSDADVDELAGRDPHNIVLVDVPRERDGPGRYDEAARLLRAWIAEGVLVADATPSLTIYRMAFDDEAGARRAVSGVLGALEVTDAGAGGVLPHERTTPKASTDRLDLTRATNANLSPIWGLSLAAGLTALLEESAEEMGSVTVEGVTHTVERISDADRVNEIGACVGSDDVLIADGHHRYGVAREYRDELRAQGAELPAADLTLAFVSELVAEQLSVAPIHRLYAEVSAGELRPALERHFHITDAGDAGDVAKAVVAEPALAVLWNDGTASWLTPRDGAFEGLRALDGVWLEHALDGTDHTVTYQHGAAEALAAVRRGDAVAAVLIRPVGVEEITRTAREGVLMPPKSTFFIPKLRTGLVVRSLDGVT